MLNLLAFYTGWNIGKKHGSKIVGAIKIIIKGCGLIFSIPLWVDVIRKHSDFLLFSMNDVPHTQSIIYCIIVWGGIAAHLLLLHFKNIDLKNVYSWVLVISTIAILVINSLSGGYGDYRVVSALFSPVLAFFVIQFPALVCNVMDSLVRSDKSIKTDKNIE